MLKKPKTKTAKTKIRRSARASQATPLRSDYNDDQNDPLETALAAAALLAEPYPEEAEAIDNVIRFVRDYRHGRLARVQLRDVLLALSIILGATDHDLTPEERDMLDVLEITLAPLARAGSVCVPDAAARQPLSVTAMGRALLETPPAPLLLTPFPFVRLAA